MPRNSVFKQCIFARVRLARHDKASIEECESRVAQRPDALEFYAMTGHADDLLRVVLRDTKDYEAFLQETVFSSARAEIVSLIYLSSVCPCRYYEAADHHVAFDMWIACHNRGDDNRSQATQQGRSGLVNCQIIANSPWRR